MSTLERPAPQNAAQAVALWSVVVSAQEYRCRWYAEDIDVLHRAFTWRRPVGRFGKPQQILIWRAERTCGRVHKRSVQSAPYPPSGDVHAGCDWRKKSSSCRSVSSARDASVLLDPRGE